MQPIENGGRMHCKICQKDCEKKYNTIILNKYNAEYFYCEHCNFLFVGKPEIWLDEAYKESINLEDTGIMQRNIAISQNLAVVLYAMFGADNGVDGGRYLDFAGGYGILTRLMRDIGFDFYWNDAYSENLVARGFEGELGKRYNAVTAFEAFEHFLEPMQEIEKMVKMSKTIIFTTELLPHPIPEPNDWWYYGVSHGQHICFYSELALQVIAAKLNLRYVRFLNLHIFCKENELKKIKNISKLFCIKLMSKYYIRNMKKKLQSKTFSDHLKMSGGVA